jgi:hypothetical protein
MSGRDSSVGIATGNGLDDPGSNPVRSEIFHTRPDRGAHPGSGTVGPVSFLVAKRPGRGADHPPPTSAEVMSV